MSRVLSVARRFAVLVIASAAAPVWAQQPSAQQIDHTHSAATLEQLAIRFEPTGQSGAVIARGIGAAVRLFELRSIFVARRTEALPTPSVSDSLAHADLTA